MSNQPRVGFLFSAARNLGGGTAFDNRMAYNYGYLVIQSEGASAIVQLRVSHDSTGWMLHSTYTAATGVTGTAQVAGYLPFVQGFVSALYSGGGLTGTPTMHWSPGLQG